MLHEKNGFLEKEMAPVKINNALRATAALGNVHLATRIGRSTGEMRPQAGGDDVGRAKQGRVACVEEKGGDTIRK